jgi:7-cyano-7-deazaguanine synthase in queuosine biosynthesis
MDHTKQVLVTFSGGRDSSSVAVEMAKQGYFITLYTYQAGMPELTGFLGDSAPDIRHKELLKAFPGLIDEHRVIEGSLYLVRKLAIEKTNSAHVVYPIALALAFHCGAILYCLKHGIKDLACGYSGYQAKEDRYIEQRDDFFNLMKDFVAEYGISYHAPAITKSKQEVIDTLEMHGVSSNSMENKSVFGGIDFDVSKALDYWNECIPYCKEYIAEMKKTFI